MSAWRTRIVLAGLLAAAAAVLSLSVGFSLASVGGDRVPPRYVSTEASKQATRRDVERRVADLTLPPWAERVSRRSPLTSPGQRGRSPYFSLYLNGHEISSTAFLSFRGDQRSALRWFLEHRPSGTVHTYRSASSAPAKIFRCLSFVLTEDRPAVGERQLVVCAVKRRGRTSVRVDALSVWLEGRSPYERIPGGSRYMEVIVTTGPDHQRRSIATDPARIDSVVDLVNSLPVTPRYTCADLDEPSAATPTVEVVFRSSRGGLPIAELTGEPGHEGQCPPLLFSLRGRRERELGEGWLVLRALHEPIARLRR